MRVGTGYDVHALVKGRQLVIGGVEIKWHSGLEGHSDGDVLLHAICDACLGAAAMGDIGVHFPPGDKNYLNIDSRILVREVYRMLAEHQWVISNIDCTVIAEKPRLRQYISSMVKNISEDLHIQLDQVNVKATTTEGLGYIGLEQGIAAQAIVMIKNY